MSVLAWVADIWIVGTYLLVAKHPARLRWFNRANSYGCIPVLAVEAGAHVWQAFALTLFFGIGGWWGLAGSLW